MRTIKWIVFVVVFLFIGTSMFSAFADESNFDQATVKNQEYSPYAGHEYPTSVFWGDLHLHTANSFDAAAMGNRLGPDVAYRFASGEEVTSMTGQRVKLSRPLDFLAVTDHAEEFGTMQEMIEGNPDMLADPVAKRWHEMIKAGGDSQRKALMEVFSCLLARKFPDVMTSPKLIRSIWQKYTATADRYNNPGKFTTLIAYEWTSSPEGDNLHRNVIFRDGADKVNQTLPVSGLEIENPEDLWNALQGYEERTGGRVLTIPHNSNLSNGRMFAPVDFLGHPLTHAYAKKRARWEPLVEVTQTKGTSETHPALSPNDEFAGYAIWDRGNIILSETKKPEMLPYEYARSGLKFGLKLEEQLGVDPYKFGMVGGTDMHTSLSAAEENSFFGVMAISEEPSAHRWNKIIMSKGDIKPDLREESSAHRGSTTPMEPGSAKIIGWEEDASGYTAVWAKENTREAIFDAMMRKEVYATTGPRMIVRFFGGWDFEPRDAQTRMPASVGYEKGTPMGGDLRSAPEGKVPTFLVAALKDPIGANLDRIQIVKGWLDAKGDLREKVYDVVWSDGRKPDKEGKLPPVGNTVDVKNATWTNTIGVPELITVWKDLDFDPKRRAFYYTRVIEIPTPRWTAYDAKHYSVQMGKDVPMVHQERAYTSPIWYTPAK